MYVRSGQTQPYGLAAILIAVMVVLWGVRPLPRGDLAVRWSGEGGGAPISLAIDRAIGRLELYRGPDLLGVFPCAIDPRQAHRIPAGRYRIHHQRAGVEQHREYLIAYPSLDLAQYARQQGWIGEAELERVTEAHRYGLLPPQDTRLGPAFCIAGGGTSGAGTGRIQLADEDLEQFAPLLGPGIEVVIR